MKNYYVVSLYYIGTFNSVVAVFENLTDAKKFQKKEDKGGGYWNHRIDKIKGTKNEKSSN